MGNTSLKMNKTRTFRLVAMLVLMTLGLTQCATNSSNQLFGVWRIIEIQRIRSDTFTTNSSPLPSQAIFTPSHYSLVWMPGETAMRQFTTRWVPTEEEMIKRYGEIVVNSGTYTIDGEFLVLRPTVSRVPEFMGGGTLYYEFAIEEDRLILSSYDEYSYDGVQTPGAEQGNTVKLTLEKVE